MLTKSLFSYNSLWLGENVIEGFFVSFGKLFNFFNVLMPLTAISGDEMTRGKK